MMFIALQYMSIMTQQWWSSHGTPLGCHSPGISGNSLDVLLKLLSAPEIKATLRYLTRLNRGKPGKYPIWFDDFPSYKPPFSLRIFHCHVWLSEEMQPRTMWSIFWDISNKSRYVLGCFNKWNIKQYHYRLVRDFDPSRMTYEISDWMTTTFGTLPSSSLVKSKKWPAVSGSSLLLLDERKTCIFTFIIHGS